MTTLTEETAVATDLPEVRDLPALDADAVHEEARQIAIKFLGITTYEETAKKAAELLEDLIAKRDKAHTARDAAAYTLTTSYRVRYGANIPGALGVGRSRWMKIRRRQEELKPAPVADADKKLPKLARQAALLAAQAELVTSIRDDAVLQLVGNGWTNAAVARLIDRDPARVSHVKHTKTV